MTTFDKSPVPDYLRLARLDGKGFVVFGGGQGIGRQAAHALTQAGAKVVCVGRSREMTEEVAKEVGGFAALGDATKRADVERIFDEAAQKLGGVHGVVDTLGMVRRKPLLDFTDEDWDWQFDIVLRHAFLAAQIGGKTISKFGGGTITFVGSTAGMVAASNHTAYCAAKAALHHLVRTASLELAPLKVRINVVTPGVVKTPRVQGYLDTGRGANAVKFHPLGRLEIPAEVASAILFMASDQSAYVTGETLLTDGGYLAQAPMPDTVWFES